MRFDYRWDEKCKLWMVVDTQQDDSRISVHWTSTDAVIYMMKLEELYENGEFPSQIAA